MTDTEKLKQFILKRKTPLTNFKTELTAESHLVAEQFLDSFGVLELIAYVEDTFGITLDRDELGRENFGTINAILAFVRSKKETRGRV